VPLALCISHIPQELFVPARLTSAGWAVLSCDRAGLDAVRDAIREVDGFQSTVLQATPSQGGQPAWKDVAAVLNKTTDKTSAIVEFFQIDEFMLDMIEYARSLPGIVVTVIPPVEDFTSLPSYVISRSQAAATKIADLFETYRTEERKVDAPYHIELGQALGYAEGWRGPVL